MLIDTKEVQIADNRNTILCNAIKQIANGNISALDYIYNNMKKVMFSVALMYTHNLKDAEDCVHDVFLIIVKKAGTFVYNKNAYSWINTIVRNTAKNKRRKNTNLREVSLDKANDIGSYVNEETIIVHEIFSLLTKKEQDIIIYKYWYGLSLTEIGEIINKPKTTTLYLVNKIEEKIKKHYENETFLKKS